MQQNYASDLSGLIDKLKPLGVRMIDLHPRRIMFYHPTEWGRREEIPLPGWLSEHFLHQGRWALRSSECVAAADLTRLRTLLTEEMA